MEKSLAVANEFIRLACAAGKPPTQMKLQKLIFFAHGWNLALTGTPLVDEQFQAWKYGPVIPSVYHEFKNFGLMGINREAEELLVDPNGNSIHWRPVSLKDNTGATQALIEKIWDIFGKYSGTHLSKMTHLPDTPWSKAREGYPEDKHNIPIPDEAIRPYFESLRASA